MRTCLFALLTVFCQTARGQNLPWPVLKHYQGKFLDRVAMPVGGIGTGNISISGNGQWKDVEIMNKPGMGFYGSADPKLAPCFLVYTQEQKPKGSRKAKMLAGPLPISAYQGQQGSVAPNNGFPRFRSVSFDAAYPFATLHLDDPEMPISAKLRCFNPFIPADELSSGIPIAIMRYEITNKTSEPLTVSVAGSMDNFIGMDGSRVEFNSFDRLIYPLGGRCNRNQFQATSTLAGIFMTSDSVDKDDASWGTMALTTSNLGPGYHISYRRELDPKGWNADVSDLWNDFADDGQFTDTLFAQKQDVPHTALAVEFTLGPHQSKQIQFLLTWDFPNRKSWDDKVTVGNYYASKYRDAWDVAEKTLPDLPHLERLTLAFVNLLMRSDYPQVLKEAALFNSSTLRSQTTFRTRDGNFFGWEGVFNSTGSCYGNCTHVWNYEQATAFLYGSLARSMRETEFHYGLNDTSGLMSFRVSLPLNKKSNWPVAAADGQMGTVMKMYRDWQLSGDNQWLQDMWPLVKKTLGFAWIAGGWDPNHQGVMTGCQHNTMDIEYFGPNPEVEFWYLGALKAASAMAAFLKDSSFERRCQDLFIRGSRWTDQHLFNGAYYIQQILPVADKSQIAPGLFAGMGAGDVSHPDFQIGEGCLVDQLVGQYMAHICGLGSLADTSHLKKTMQSIWTYNYIRSYDDQFNNMRTYGLGNESGLVLTAYPDPSKRPKIPLSYCMESWTGFEYTAATEMIYEGMEAEAIQTVTNVRNRYDGYKRNPFNEEECGNHYARAMASWATILAWSRFTYSGVTGTFTITSRPGVYFWSNGYAWGDVRVTKDRVSLHVVQGKLTLRQIKLQDAAAWASTQPIVIMQGTSREFIVSKP